jgi:hypothetical protein
VTARRRARHLGGNVVALRPLWSTDDVAECLALSARTVRRWRVDGRGPGWFRVGQMVRYDPAEVYRWLHEDCEWSGSTVPVSPESVAVWQAAARTTQRRRRSQRLCSGQLHLRPVRGEADE